MPPALTARNVVFGCVANNTPKFLAQTLRLLRSLRWFGGSLAEARFIPCFVDAVDPAYRAEFERLGATVRLVQTFHPANPHPNKLRFLELPELARFEAVVLLDCDTIVVQDPAPFIQLGTFQARIAGYPTVSTKVFRRLFARFALPLPPEDYRCSVSGDPTILYCNTGVVLVSGSARVEFFPVWRDSTRELCDQRDLLAAVGNMCEQASLSLALVRKPVPFSELPLKLNCPVPEDQAQLGGEVGRCDPVIVHYHHRVDRDGFILSNANPYARRRIEAFNDQLRQQPALPRL